jgi:hypothetical protein
MFCPLLKKECVRNCAWHVARQNEEGYEGCALSVIALQLCSIGDSIFEISEEQ